MYRANSISSAYKPTDYIACRQCLVLKRPAVLPVIWRQSGKHDMRIENRCESRGTTQDAVTQKADMQNKIINVLQRINRLTSFNTIRTV
jgi:hypothetical protein